MLQIHRRKVQNVDPMIGLEFDRILQFIIIRGEEKKGMIGTLNIVSAV